MLGFWTYQPNRTSHTRQVRLTKSDQSLWPINTNSKPVTFEIILIKIPFQKSLSNLSFCNQNCFNQNNFCPDLSPFAFSCGLRFFLSSDAGLFIVFMFADLAHNAGALASTFESTQSAVKGLILPDFDFAHCFPSPRNNRPMQLKRLAGLYPHIYVRCCEQHSILRKLPTELHLIII